MSIEQLKDEGNGHLKQGEFDLAISKYTQAIDIYSSSSVFVDALVVAVCYANRSLVHLRLGKVDPALADAKQAVCFAPEYAKAYHRMGKALQAMGREEEGLRALQKSACINSGMSAKEAERAIRKHEISAKKKAQREAREQAAKSASEDAPIKARDDGRSEQERWNLAEQFLTQPKPWPTIADPPLSVTYLLRSKEVAWRMRDEDDDWEWMPYCAGRRRPGEEEESDF